MADRASFIVGGRAVGTGTGWDIADTFAVQIYDFEAALPLIPNAGCVTFDYEAGTIFITDDKGEIVGAKLDLIETLQHFPKAAA